MTEIVQVPIETIDANPWRRIHDYPYIDSKLRLLMESIKDVGLWESVIARRRGNHYELAFGHHRIEAARRMKMKVVPLIVRKLTDEEMLMFMGRENLEDYNTDFLAMLETWEAAVQLLTKRDKAAPKDITVAKFLGWDAPGPRARSGDKGLQLNSIARACSIGAPLVAAQLFKRADFAGLTTSDALAVLAAANGHFLQIDSTAKATNRPPEQVALAKDAVVRGSVFAATGLRMGKLSRQEAPVVIHKAAHKIAQVRTPPPVFGRSVRLLAGRISRMLIADSKVGIEIDAVEKALAEVTLEEDRAAVAELATALNELALRAQALANSLRKGKVIPFHEGVRR